MENLFSVKGKVIVITGGYGYLGIEFVKFFLRNNAIVYLTGNNQIKLDQITTDFSNKSFDVKTKYLDISDTLSIKSAFEDIYNTNGAIDVLINNAVYGNKLRVKNLLSLDQWNLALDGTLGGVYRCSTYVVPYMENKNKGSIINIASMYGIVSPDPDIYSNNDFSSPVGYSVGKSAIIQFTKHFAGTYGRKGIRANSVSPGPFPNLEVQKDLGFIEHLKSKNPLHRIGKPEDLFGVIILLSSEAGAFITGQNICVDEGWTSW